MADVIRWTDEVSPSLALGVLGLLAACGGVVDTPDLADGDGGAAELVAVLVTAQSATISGSVGSADQDVIVNPQFLNTMPGLLGTTTSITVDTSGAANFVSSVVSVVFVDVQSVVGTWTGSWEADQQSTYHLADGTPLTAPAGPGTFELDLTAADTSAQTATGTIHWTGMDVSWTPNADNSAATSAPFSVDETFSFDMSDAKIFDVGSMMSLVVCEGYWLQLNLQTADYSLNVTVPLDSTSSAFASGAFASSPQGAGLGPSTTGGKVVGQKM